MSLDLKRSDSSVQECVNEENTFSEPPIPQRSPELRKPPRSLQSKNRRGRPYLRISSSFESIPGKLGEDGQFFINDNKLSNPNDNFMETRFKKRSVSKDALIWMVYASFMAKSWQKTRKSLLEQIHHSEYSEMRTRSAMVHVFTMKMKLNNGVGKIKENVKQMNVMETMKTHLESQINQIQSDNIRLRAKIRNLSIRKCDADRTLGNLRSKIVVVDERMETLQSKILKTRTYHQRLKKEKDDLLEKLRNSYGTFDTIKDRITSSAKNIRNLKIEVEYKKNCLNGLCDVILGTDNEIIDSTRVIDRITRELEVAQEGRAVLENRLSEIMKKAIEDESTISSLNEKIATANVNLLALKSKK